MYDKIYFNSYILYISFTQIYEFIESIIRIECVVFHLDWNKI